MTKFNREDLAWAAGLFEGEGSFTTNRRSKYIGISAMLGMTDEDRVRKFHDIIGVGNVTAHADKRIGVTGAPWKTMYVWKTASFEGVQHAIASLWYWLGPRRRAKAKEIMIGYHKNEFHTKRFTLALSKEVNHVKQLLKEGVSKRTIARLVGRSYGFVNHIKQSRTHGEAT